jgi:pyruvate/2-oxoacid:ferredoxin oxidoreductase alpha subunit
MDQTSRMINGAEAMATAFILAGVRIAYTFPITPQSEVMDYFAEQSGFTCINADSEYNVLAGAEGVLWSGQRCAVATASQGLILMSELMWEVSGNRLPLVMGVFNRGLKGPGWCLGSQHNDSLFMRDTGWLQFYCESAQEILDMVLIGYRLAERIQLPVMIAGDGFYLSHEREEVLVPSAAQAETFVGKRDASDMPLSRPPASYGGLVPPQKYYALFRQMHRDVEGSLEVFQEVAAEFEATFGRRYDPVEEADCDEADIVLISAGTISGTIRKALADAGNSGHKVGFLKLRAFRPFPAKQLRRAMLKGKKVAVLDRSLALGVGGIFGSELRTVFTNQPESRPLFSFVAGLGGLDVTPGMVTQLIDYVARTDSPPEGALFLTETGIEE